MLAETLAFGLHGAEGFAVQVEVFITNGLPSFDIVGLPDAAVKESKDRIRAALMNSGFHMPISRVTVNLAPADIKKEGPGFDLPITIAVLMASKQIEVYLPLNEILLLGEVSLKGELAPIKGVLPMVIDAYKKGITKVIVPNENGKEVECIEGIQVYTAENLTQVIQHLNLMNPLLPQKQKNYHSIIQNRKTVGHKLFFYLIYKAFIAFYK